MKVGTRSLLFGVHAFWWHPITVWLAWVRLYGEFPSWRETVCIFVHDFGYWGCSEMDGPEGERHPERGAKIVGFLFGFEEYKLVLHHSRTYAKKLGAKESALCWPDKASMVYDPTWFYLIRARLSGELKEYRANADRNDFVPSSAPDRVWHRKLVERLERRAIIETSRSR